MPRRGALQPRPPVRAEPWQRFYGQFLGRPRFRLEEEENDAHDGARVVFDLTAFDDPDHYLAESAMAVAHRFAGWLIRRRISLTRVEFSYPALGHALEYDLLYGAPCSLRASRTALVFDRSVLDRPVLQDEAGLHAFLRRGPGDVLAHAFADRHLPLRRGIAPDPTRYRFLLTSLLK